MKRAAGVEIRGGGWRAGAARLLGALVIAVGLTACGSARGFLPADRATAPAPGSDAVAVFVPQSDAGRISEVAPSLEQAAGQEVRILTAPDDAYLDRAAAALLSGSQEYDLLLLPSDSLARWVSYTALLALDEAAPDGLALDITPWREPLTVDGRIYALPAAAEIDVLWYRSDLLSAAGLPVPATWEAFRSAAERLNAPPERYGAVIAGSAEAAGADLAAILPGFGGRVLSDDRRPLMGGAAGRGAMALYAGLAAANLVPPESLEYSRADVIAALAEGRAGMGLAPLSARQRLLDCASSPNTCRAGQPVLAWARLPGLPQGEAVGSLRVWVIPLKAAHPTAAAELAQVLANPMTIGKQTGLAGDIQLGSIERFQTAFPPLTTADDVWAALNSAGHAAAAGQLEPDAAAQAAEQRLEEAVRRSGMGGN